MYMYLPHWLDLLNMNIVEHYFMCTKKGTITHGSAKKHYTQKKSTLSKCYYKVP